MTREDGPGRPLLRFIELVVSHCEANFVWSNDARNVTGDSFGRCFHHRRGFDEEKIVLTRAKEALRGETFDEPFPDWPAPLRTSRDTD